MLPDDHQNKEWFWSTVWREVSAAVNQTSGVLLELRDQSNQLISHIHDFYRQISGLGNSYHISQIEGYLKFVAFVLFGKTELTGYGQRGSDEDLKRDSESSIDGPKPGEGADEEDFDGSTSDYGGDPEDVYGDEFNERYTLKEHYYNSLLLETPATAANIERFIKKYFSGLSPQNLQYNVAANYAKEFLEKWTPRLQQIIKAAGGNPDVFAYSSVEELEEVIANSQTSKTEEKKAFKAATDANIPLVQETDKYLVYQPLTWEASRKYFGINRESLLDGTKKKGAKWCTAAAEDKTHFNDYVVKAKDRLLYFIRKRDDKLFAARSSSIANKEFQYASDRPEKRYQGWLKTVELVLKAVKKTESSKEYTQAMAAAKKARAIKNIDDLSFVDYDAIHNFDKLQRQIYTVLLRLEPAQIRECRDQQNKKIWRLYDLYTELNKKPPTIEEYIAFIKFVVFGKTE